MTEGTQPQPPTEFTRETLEVTEAKQQLDRAAYDPAADVDPKGDIPRAETLEKAFVAAVELAPQLDLCHVA